MFSQSTKTWTIGVTVIVIGVSISYGIWFDYLDSLPGIGKLFGGNTTYQPWNIIGHFIPGLAMVIFNPKKLELFIAGFLISTVVMDSPLWGVERVYAHHGQLWLQHGNTKSLHKWMAFYYNPIGQYSVWGTGLPTAAMLFWSIVGRLMAVITLICYQNKLETKVFGRRIMLFFKK